MTDDNRHEPEPWHISRAVSITHILSTITIVGALFVYFSDVNSRVNSNSLDIEHLQKNLVKDRKAAERRYDDFRTDLRTINGKLDRLIEYTRDNAGDQ